MSFEEKACRIMNENPQAFNSNEKWDPQAECKDGNGSKVPRALVKAFVSSTQVESIELWRRRLSHLNQNYLRQLRNGTATGINFSNDPLPKCENCVYGKLVKKPFQFNDKRATQKLELVYSDL